VNLPPPPPPRPDLDVPGIPESWRIVDPGRMNAPAVVGAGMRLWSENWLRWGLITLMFAGTLSVALAALDPQPALPTQPSPTAVGMDATEVSGLLLTFVAGLLLGPWLYVILARASLLATFAPDRGGLIARTIRGVPSLLWIFVILFAAAMAAVIPIAVVGAAIFAPIPTEEERAVLVLLIAVVLLIVLLWLVPRLILVVHAYVAEDRRGTKAIAEAWRRTRKVWWMVLGAIVLNILIGFAVSLIPTSIANTAFPDATVAHAVPRAVIQALTNALVTPIGVAITSALYLELSARKGVLSQETLARNLSRFDDR
jgi:hypothetical protein